MKRGLLIGGGVVVIAIAVGVYFLISNLGGIIKTAVEKYGSEILKAEVTLNEVDFSTSSGQAWLKGFNIGNPEGFNTDRAFALGAVDVTVDTGTITDDTIVIKEIVVEAPDVTYELGGSGSNLNQLKENADAYVEVATRGGGGEETAEGKKLIIENLYIREAKMNVSATFLGGKKFGATLPEIHLADIGKDKGGAGPGEIVDKVITALTDTATATVSNIDFGDMAGKVQEQLGDLMSGAGGMAGQAGDMMKKATEGATGGAADIMNKATEGGSGAGDMIKEGGDALKGLLGGKK
jgi:hypothetical protein